MSPTIRSATQADQVTIRRLIREAGINPMSLDWPNFVVADDDGAIVGVGQIKSHGDGSRELASIAVVPTRQGEGIARALIETLLARERRVVLYLTCRRELEGLYQRFGFRKLKRAEYPPYFRRMIPLVNLAMKPFGIQILVMRRDAAGSEPDPQPISDRGSSSRRSKGVAGDRDRCIHAPAWRLAPPRTRSLPPCST